MAEAGCMARGREQGGGGWNRRHGEVGPVVVEPGLMTVIGREGAHPCATGPRHQTCRIMVIYGDG